VKVKGKMEVLNGKGLEQVFERPGTRVDGRPHRSLPRLRRLNKEPSGARHAPLPGPAEHELRCLADSERPSHHFALFLRAHCPCCAQGLVSVPCFT
jgi:hypothetical protein